MKIIVVEGIDRVGKTTLCNMLKEVFGDKAKMFKDDFANFMQSCTNNEKSIAAYSSMNSIIGLSNSLGYDDEVLILDRFHATEFVYGIIEREANEIESLQRFNEIEKKLEMLEKDYLYVYIKPTNVTLSSKLHGSDLQKHDEEFEFIYFNAISPANRMTFDFNSLSIAKDYIYNRFCIRG